MPMLEADEFPGVEETSQLTQPPIRTTGEPEGGWYLTAVAIVSGLISLWALHATR
jgi:hypothetical protein